LDALVLIREGIDNQSRLDRIELGSYFLFDGLRFALGLAVFRLLVEYLIESEERYAVNRVRELNSGDVGDICVTFERAGVSEC